MPVNDRKVINIVLDQTKKVEERCPGYRAALIDAIADIMAAERQHRVQGTAIQRKVSDKCSAVGTFLLEGRNSRGARR
jgi:hypothetical protein